MFDSCALFKSIYLKVCTMPRKNMNLPYYVCNERIFDSRQNIFEKLLEKLVDHISTLLVAPFASKLVNLLRHSESLKYV